MTLKAWHRLRSGSLIQSAKTGVLRSVLKARRGYVSLRVIRRAKKKPRSLIRTTVYVSCDRKNFKVLKF